MSCSSTGHFLACLAPPIAPLFRPPLLYKLTFTDSFSVNRRVPEEIRLLYRV